MDENAAEQPTYPELTDEQRAQIDVWLTAHPRGEQDENGIDLSAIRRNLTLTPTQRLRRLEERANALLKLRQACQAIKQESGK